MREGDTNKPVASNYLEMLSRSNMLVLEKKGKPVLEEKPFFLLLF